MAKYLDTTGLTYFWGKVKAYVAQYVTENVTDTTYGEATTSAAGLMSAADKAKLDGIATGADVTTVVQALTEGTAIATVNGTTLFAPTAGESPTYSEATQTTSGLMSAADKTKLDSLEATEAITTTEIDAIVSAA